jgi:putative DNA primase/helicase
VKSNLGPTGDGWEFKLEQTKVDDVKAQRAVWGNALTGGPKKLLDEAEGVEEEPKRASRKDEASRFLRGLLANGAVPANWVWNAVRNAGHSEKTIKRAKKSLRVITDKIGDAGWTWRLPTPEDTFKEPFQPLTTEESDD